MKTNKNMEAMKISTILMMKKDIPADIWKDMYKEIIDEEGKLFLTLPETEKLVKQLIRKYRSTENVVKERETIFLENFFKGGEGTKKQFNDIVAGWIPFVRRLSLNSKRRHGMRSTVEPCDLEQEALEYLLTIDALEKWTAHVKKNGYIPYVVFHRFKIGKIMKAYCIREKAVMPLLDTDPAPEALDPEERIVPIAGTWYTAKQLEDGLKKLSPTGREIVYRLAKGQKIFKWQRAADILDKVNEVFPRFKKLVASE
jgi:hypothetical protein